MTEALDDVLRLWHGWAAILAVIGIVGLVVLALDRVWDRLFARGRHLKQLQQPPRSAIVRDLEAERERRDRIVHRAIRGVPSNRTTLTPEALAARRHLDRIAAIEQQRLQRGGR